MNMFLGRGIIQVTMETNMDETIFHYMEIIIHLKLLTE